MIKRILILGLGFGLSVVVGCGSSTSTYSSSTSSKTSPSSTSALSSSHKSTVDSLVVSNVSTRKSSTLEYVKGEIRNTSSQDIDDIINIAILDSSGNLITVKPMTVKVKANGTMYFEELVGNNVPSASSVKLQD